MWILAIGLIVLTLPFLWGTWAILVVLMLPSLVSWFVDRTEQRNLFRSVLAVNIVGTLPAITDLWLNVQFYDPLVVSDILNTVWYYLLAYGCSAIGWALFAYVPRLIGEHMARQARHRVVRLRRRQEVLVSEWGDKVKAGVPMADSNDAEMLDAALGGAEPLGLDGGGDADRLQPAGPADAISEGLAQQRAI